MRIDPRHDRAARRLALGRWTMERIAAEAHVSDVTLWTWRKDKDFAACEEAHRTTLHAAVARLGIADKQRRVAGMVERHQLMQQVIEERAARGVAQIAGNTALTPGGLPRPEGKREIPAEVVTGLLVRQERTTQFGTVVEWVVDTGLLGEMRATEKQVAQELGEWVEKGELTGKGGGPLIVAQGPDLSALTLEELRALEHINTRLLGVGGADAPGADTGGDSAEESA